MLAFVVISSKGSGPLGSDDHGDRSQDPPPEVPFIPTDSLTWRSTNGSVAFNGWQAASPIEDIGPHWQEDESGLTAFSGHLWPRQGLWQPASGCAERLARELDRHDIETNLERFFGVYAIANLHDSGTSHVFADPFGAGLLYIAETHDRFVVSNRAGLAARALCEPHGRPARDPIGVGWLCFFNHILGDSTSYVGVRALPPGAYVEIDAGGRPRILQRPQPAWAGASGSEDPDAASLAYEDIMNNIESVARLNARRRIFPISGGKDSRLLLAFAMAAGVSKRFDFETNGADTHPDVIVARELAQRFDLEHRVRAPGVSSPPADEYLERLRVHAFHTSGMLGAAYLRGGTGIAVDHVTVGGMFGEVMRSHYARDRRIEGESDLGWFFAREVPFDPAGILRPDVERHYRAYVNDWVAEQLDSGIEPADVPDVFYLRHRIPRWVGTIQELHTGLLVHPLQALSAARWAAAAGAEARRTDGLHFQLMRRACAELTKMRFAEDAWHESLYRSLPDAADYRRVRPAEASVEPPPRGSTYPAIRTCLKEYLLSDPSHPAFEVIDHKRLERAVGQGGRLPSTARVALYGALGIGVWLGGDENAVPFNLDPRDVPVGRPLLETIRARRVRVSDHVGGPGLRGRVARPLLWRHLLRTLSRRRLVRRVLAGRSLARPRSRRDVASLDR